MISPYRSLVLLLVAVLVSMLFTGCAVNKSSITADGVEASTTPASMATMDNAGEQKASFIGVPPTQLKQDATGSWLTTPGQGAVVTIDPTTHLAYIWSPKDGKIESLKVNPDGAIELNGLEFNLSSVASVYQQQYADAMSTMLGMSQEQAKVYIQNAVTAGQMLPDVAETLMKAFVPNLSP